MRLFTTIFYAREATGFPKQPGGDEGSRTPVRKYCCTTFSERSRHTLIRAPDAWRRASRSLSRLISLTAHRSQPQGIPQCDCPSSPAGGAWRTVAVKLLKRILYQRLYLNVPPINVLMEPRLAYHTSPTPVETSTSPVVRACRTAHLYCNISYMKRQVSMRAARASGAVAC